ncbi:surface antigen BspA [Tannerella forsythia KS16]|uniref:leucine-rich repeat protein n=1 Tax=Tannerella forsythia TaxID=28112 RepID=UPI000618A304|nr:leucine-rich repeat protein [Tannerella forsythia]BAR52016.1 surface antigen BspA [Tannerella forsythia KS16]
MPNFDSDDERPWKDVRYAPKVVIGAGVTSVGDLAINGFWELTDLTLPDGLQTIGTWAFLGCVSLTNLTLPKSVTSIGLLAFSNCKALKEVTVFWDTPLTISADAFQGIELNKVKLYVPAGKKGAYQAADVWKGFDVQETEGNLSTGLHWQYIPSTKTLSITGSGDMPDFGPLDQPWESFQDEIETATIGAGVTSVGENAFANCSALTDVTLPAGLKTIGEDAFGGCEKLASITLPSSLQTLGVAAFSGCDALTRIELPAALETIGTNALNAGGLTEIKVQTGNTHFEAEGGVLYNKGKTKLLRYPPKKPGTTFAVPASVTTIEAYAFSKCAALESITLPDALETIGTFAFYECKALKSVIIPKKVGTIGDYAFRECTGLKDVTVLWNTPLTIPPGVFGGITPPTGVTLHVPGGTGEAYQGKDVWKELTIEELPWGDLSTGLHWAYDAADHSLTITNPTPSTPQPIPGFANPTKQPWKAYRGDIQEVTIGAGVNHVGKNAFTNCAKLTSVTLPDGLKEIEKNAFGGCEKLASISIPKSVTAIGQQAFAYCVALASVTIPNGVTAIADGVFASCAALKSVTLPDGLQTIGKNAFFRCRSLTNLTIPKNVTTIGQSAFTECTALKSITIPNSVTAIADGVFAGCKALTTVTLPDGLQTIGQNAFLDCAALASISIPNSVTAIEDFAFQGCSALKDVTVAWETPLDNISAEVFNHLTLEEIRLHVPEGKIGAYKAANVWHYFIVMSDRGDLAGGLKWQMDATYTLTIINPTPGSPKPMPDFNNWDEQPWKSFRSEIQAVTIEDGVSSVGETAFSGCTEMKSVTLPKSVTTIHEGAFGGCNKLTSVTLPADGRLDTIGKEAFSDCSALTSISLPKSATTIENRAFSGCEALTSVTLPADGKLQTIGVNAFGGCVKLKRITLPNSVTKIEGSAFSRCKELTSVTLPDNAQFTKIESDAFQNCTALERITIPSHVTTIEGDAFYGCTALASATLPKSVTTIEDAAFKDCKALKDMTVAWTDTASIPNITLYVFQYTPPDTVKLSGIRLHVPHGTVAAYQSKDVWKEFQIIEAVPPTPTLSVTPKTLSFIDAGETKTITVNASAAWTAQCDASWITLSAASGTGDGTITVTAPAYEDEQPRTAKIIFVSGALKETVTVTQNPKPGPAFVALDYTELTLPAGASQRLVVTAYPKDADINRDVKWYSSNNDIASVSRDGTVTALAPGRADITVVANVGGQQTACRVRVVPAEQMVSVASGGDNTLRLALVAPSDADFTLSFDVDLPEGFALDAKKTAPDASLAAGYAVTVTGKRVEMKPNGLRSGGTMEKRNLLTFACTAAPGTSKGSYKAALRNFTFTPTAGYALQNITVPFTFTHTVANQTIDGLRVYAAGGALHLTLPKAETVHIYNVVGSLVRTMNASAGDHVLPLSSGMYVVRVGERVTKILIK